MSHAPLTPERMARLQECFERALDLEAVAREEYLRGLGQQDPELAGRMSGLLAAHAQTGSALESPVVDVGPSDEAADPWIGRRVGAYEITRRIGVGGMGAVYEAVRGDGEFRKRVAIKLLRTLALDTPSVRRFRRERQILATLEHPHIATLIDGGVTSEGHPYFAMEYVDGAPLTTYCDARTLGVAERLVLFRQVCAAVQFAHQNLVVHRDLKPQNVLVTADGQVKLLDFGIAALLPAALGDDDAETLTRVGGRALTPGYASPEQLAGRAVGTRSDVYSLGVVLYELLCGRRPFDARARFKPGSTTEVDDTEPPRPSSVITGERLAQLSERSSETARTRIAGDLDAIVLKALRAEPDRRYGSAEELSADIARHLEGRPVLARPDSLPYRLGKLWRRRRLETVALTLALLAVLGGTGVALRQAQVAEREKERAQREEARATEVTAFLTTMLGAASPGALGKDVTVRQVLDSAVRRADALREQPQLDAQVRRVIGGTFLALGEFALADSQFVRSVAAERQVAPQGSRNVARALSQLSMAREFAGDFTRADSLLRMADTLFARHGFEDAEQEISHLDARGRLLVQTGQLSEAEQVLTRALARQRQQRPPNDSSISASYANLAIVQSDRGNNASAETLMVAAVAAARRAFGREHPQVAAILSPLASIQDRAGYAARAESTFLETIAMRRKLLGESHPDLAWTMYNFSDVLLRQKRFAESAVWARRVLAMRGGALGEQHPIVAASMTLLGRSLDGLDSLRAGERWLRESLALRRSLYPAGHFLIASTEGMLGEHFARQGDFARAEPMLHASERALVAARGNAAPMVQDARARLVDLYRRMGKPDSVRVWEARIREAGGG